MPRVSIIVPVYNKRDYIESCLRSLLGQTLSDIEVVCVDDGSTDGSADVVASIAEMDPRVRFLSQQNAGPGPARNAGMAAATGDILMFVDADDELVHDACECVATTFAEKYCEVLTFGYSIVPPEATHPSLRRHLAPRDVTFEGFDPRVLFDEDARPFAARTAISSDFAHREGIRWEPTITLGDDQFFHFEVYPRSRRTTLCSRQLYLYRMNLCSMTHASFDSPEMLFGKVMRHLDCEKAIAVDWESAGFMHICGARTLEWCIDLLLRDISTLPGEMAREACERLRDDILPHFGELAEGKSLSWISRACLAELLAIANGLSTSVSFVKVAMFYLRARGLRTTLERVWYGLRPRR